MYMHARTRIDALYRKYIQTYIRIHIRIYIHMYRYHALYHACTQRGWGLFALRDMKKI